MIKLEKLDLYRLLLGSEVIDPLLELAGKLKGIKIVHVNSTLEGGGVAEILSKMIPLKKILGLDVDWQIVEGHKDFFRCTKMFHNLLQGQKTAPPDLALLRAYEKTNEQNAERLKKVLEDADIVFIHDPQPLALLSHLPNKKGKWIWRCHIDLSAPSMFVWEYLKKYVEQFDASIFSLREFAQKLPHPVYLIPPSIDPLSDKNIDIDTEEVRGIYRQFQIDTKRPTILQVSRFDRFKDPLGVIQSYRLAKATSPDLQLVLAGSGAVDDPEGDLVLEEVHKEAAHDPDIHVLLLPPTSHLIINALQRGADVVLQKSLKEGFGLTVSEALWKSKPVIGGNTGGIRLQVIDQETGFLVKTPEAAATHITYLLRNPPIAQEMGCKGKKLVKEKFLITRHLLDYLTVMASHLLPPDKKVAEALEKITCTSC